MEELDQIICKINDLQNIEDTLNEYDALKAEVNTIYEQKGEDGFTVEFFKYFFNVIGSNLVDSFNHAREKGQLSILKKGGLLRLFPNQIPIYWTSKTGGQFNHLTYDRQQDCSESGSKEN